MIASINLWAGMHFWLFHLSLSFCDVGNTNFTSLNNSLLKINLVLSQIVERFVCQLSSRVAIAVIAPFWLQGIRSLHSRQRSRFPLKCATFLHHPRVFSGLLGSSRVYCRCSHWGGSWTPEVRALWPRRSGTALLHFDLQGVLNGV